MYKCIFFIILIVALQCKQGDSDKKFKAINTNEGRMEGTFINDSIMEGEFIYYSNTGYKQQKLTFSNGIKNGTSITYYSNGNIWDSSFNKMGEKHGYHFVYDSMGKLIYRDYYYYGQRFGGQTFYNDNKATRYVFNSFDHQQLFDGLYDSSKSIYKYGGEIINANLYKVSLDGAPRYGLFSYLLDPPYVNIDYKMGLINNRTNERKYLATLDNRKIFIDTIVPGPDNGWDYFISADYNDTLRKYKKIFITVLRWNEVTK